MGRSADGLTGGITTGGYGIIPSMVKFPLLDISTQLSEYDIQSVQK